MFVSVLHAHNFETNFI